MESGRIGAGGRGSQGMIHPPPPDGWPRYGIGGVFAGMGNVCTLQMAGCMLQHEIFGCHAIRL